MAKLRNDATIDDPLVEFRDTCQVEDVQGEEPFVYTSVRYDAMLKNCPENTAASFNIACPFYLLEHHWTRMQVANWSAQFWHDGRPPKAHGRPADFLYGLMYSVRQWQMMNPKEAEWAEALRIRRRAYASGRVSTEIYQIPRKPLRSLFPSSFDEFEDTAETAEWTVVLDIQPTETSEATLYKIWNRQPQSRARSDAGILSLGTTKEVLLYNHDSEIIDGSNSTPYFYRSGRWVTPTYSSGGLQGTTRRWALEQGLCVEAVVWKDSLQEGEKVVFSNAVRGFYSAIYRIRDTRQEQPDAAQARRVLQQLV